MAFELRRGRRNAARIVVAVVALPAAYQFFRMGYYGSLVPNTATAKEGSSANLSRGWRYLLDFVEPYWLWFPAIAVVAGGYVPLAAAARRNARALAVAGLFVACGALQWLYFVAVGGDYFHARLLLPGFFALLAPVAAIPATRRCLAALLVIPWALAAVLVLRPDQYRNDAWLANGFLMVHPRDFGKVTTDDFGWGDDGPWRRWYDGPAYYYERGLLDYPSAEIPVREDIDLPYGAFFGVGLAGYAPGVDFHVLDLMGLADNFTAHLDVSGQSDDLTRYPGHEKPLPSPWIAARLTPEGSRPDSADFPDFYGAGLIPATTGREFREQVAWARAALECDGIQRIFLASEAPLTPRRFAANLLRSVTTTLTRVPPDPKTAYREYCGPGTPREVRAVRSG
jgi:arabinofuranosyltransferase